MAFLSIDNRLVHCLFLTTQKSLLMWGQTDHLLYRRTLFLSICSGLDPDDTNPVFSPLLVTYRHTHTHTHTGVSLAAGRAFVSEKNRRLTCYSDKCRVLACPPHRHRQPECPGSTSQTIAALLSSFHTCRGRGGESERRPHDLSRHWCTQRRGEK